MPFLVGKRGEWPLPNPAVAFYVKGSGRIKTPLTIFPTLLPHLFFINLLDGELGASSANRTAAVRFLRIAVRGSAGSVSLFLVRHAQGWKITPSGLPSALRTGPGEQGV